jgi:ferrochelatase
MLEVAEHYYHFGGISPINAQNRDIILRLDQALQAADIRLPIFWGNRNWNPTITEALQQIQAAGHKAVLPIFTNMFSSYSGCRQYRENIAQALQNLEGPVPTVLPRLRFGFNHPRFIASQVDLVRQAWQKIPEPNRSEARLLFCAHSIPISMSDNCNYVLQLSEAASLIAAELQIKNWELVYQSRSGPPQQPWLEPDVGDRIRQLSEDGVAAVVLVPLGFVSDHLEVLYDLDTEARDICNELNVAYQRAPAVGVHSQFIMMLVDLIGERLTGNVQRSCIGRLPPLHDVCPENCCLYPRSGKGVHEQKASLEGRSHSES